MVQTYGSIAAKVKIDWIDFFNITDLLRAIFASCINIMAQCEVIAVNDRSV